MAALDLHFQVYGTGPRTLLLIHGWACSHRYWEDFAALLPSGYRAVAVDLRGFGESPKPPAGYHFDDHAADLVRLIHRLNLPRAALVGHSMGGAIALHLALGHALLFRALAIVDAGAHVAQRRQILALAGDDLFRTGMTASQLSKAVASWFHDPEDPHIPEFQRIACSSPGTIRGEALRCHIARDMRNEVQHINLPTLVLYGALDGTRSYEEAAYLRDTIPGAELRVIAGAAHSPQIERPLETAAALLDFFERRRIWPDA
ncbi:alpha/beta hydrolase [bacterium]|nr:MAG: alpha/beta hydrolase [bacterium]